MKYHINRIAGAGATMRACACYDVGRSGAASQRFGFTIVELILALSVLALFCSVFVPVLTAVTRERRTALQEQAALEHAANVLEELMARPFNELAASREATADIPQTIRDNLPQLEQAIQVRSVTDPSAAIITISLRWKSTATTWSRPVVLSGWVHPKGTP